jgi:multisubunit Na+/H+ antiporter MnhF subunit
VDPTQIRMRRLILILLAAVLTAALLRHTLHVEGGLTRKQILAAALVVLAVGTIATVAFSRWKRRRR